ncbi:MAG TPA: DUF4394 domain-containing protein [Baekduia sp.]|uniref:DUF4394 domain-containing protein n=1 Tax=Baekduia sp. TaxID=2600305 RepID=UPI002B9A961D|nr:DUF4394 domain-containing protein [Baekduia sp.]HMJ37441.1 DUF4394 domain-containing protein [Baekduia sp.]
MPSPRSLLVPAALGAALIAPSAAHAAEGFTGVTSAGQVATFQSDSIPGLESRVDVSGLPSGAKIVGLDRAPAGELLALTSRGSIATLDAATGKATMKFPAPVTSAIDPAAAVSFAVAPDGATARIIAGGRDETVTLATGAAAPTAPALGFAPGDPNAGGDPGAAVDFGTDGRLVGVSTARGAFVRETAPGSGALSTLAATPFPIAQPVRTTVGSDGAAYTVSDLHVGRKSAPPQSRMVRFDPATGRISGQNGVYPGQRFDAIASVGAVPDDTTKPTATFSGRTLHRHVSRGTAYYTGLGLKVSEGGQTVASLRLGGKVVGFGLLSKYEAGRGALQLVPRKGATPLLRSAAAHHRKVVVHLTVHDWAGNQRVYDRAMSLAR